MAEIKKINGNTLCDDVARATAEEAKAAAAQADWGENDPESPAYVKNRIGGYKRNEAERLVEYDETTAEYIDVDFGNGTMRYRKASDTLTSVADWLGANIVIGRKTAEGENIDGAEFSISVGDETAYEQLQTYVVKNDDGDIYILYSNMENVVFGALAPRDTTIGSEVSDMSADASQDYVVPKGAWILDLPWYSEYDSNSGGDDDVSIAFFAAPDSSDVITVYVKSITLGETAYIDGDAVAVSLYDDGYTATLPGMFAGFDNALNNAQTTANNAQITANNAAFDASADYLGNKVAGESEYIVPPQKIDESTKVEVAGGYRYTLKSNGEITNYDERGCNFSTGGTEYPMVFPVQSIDLGEGTIEKCHAIKSRNTSTNKVAFLTDKYVYIQSGYYLSKSQTIYIKANTDEEKVKTLDEKYLPGTVAKKSDIPTYTAGDGIAIEDGVISCTVEGGANSFTETGEMVTVYPAAHSSVGVVSTISGQNSAWDRANEIVLRQVPEGGNLLDDAFTFGEAGKVITKDGLTATINADRTVTVTGTNTAGTWNNVVSATYFSQTASYEIRPFPAGTYTLPNKLSATIRYMGGSGGTSEESGKHETFTTTAPWYIKQLYISYSADAAANETVPIALFYGQKAPTLSDYAYKGATYKKQFSAAVTDGTFDWTTGELRNTSGDLVETLEATSIKALDGANTFFVGISKNTVTGTLTSGGGTGTVVDCTDYSLPVLAFEGDISAMTKANPVTLNYTFGEHSGTLTCKWQGNSSLAYDKKNYTIKFDTAFEVNDGWGEHQKYVLKANYMDFSHCRNVVSAKLWGQIVAARATENTALKACPNYGVIDGFPITLTINGEYYGVYTMNIPKDPWMMNMGSGTNECILCAGNACPSNFFKAAATLVDDDDLEIEYITDESNTAWAVTSVNNLINACINSDGSDLDTTIATMLDWDSAIDYYIFVALLRGDDMVGKNYLLNTYDGTKWFFGAYDMDSVFGLHWSGQSFLPATTGTTFAASMAKIAENHRLFELIKTYKKDALKARYKELRTGVMSEDNVGMMFRNFAGQIPAPLLDEDNKKWTKIPNTNGNNVQQILDWYRLRVATIDAEIDKM